MAPDTENHSKSNNKSSSKGMENSLITAPFGSWVSPLEAAQVAEASVSRREPRVADNWVLWAERRPRDQGKTTIVGVELTDPGSTSPPLQPRDLTYHGDISTRVHEYGGGAWLPAPDTYLEQAGQDLGVQNLEVTGGTGPPVVVGVDATAGQRILAVYGDVRIPITGRPITGGTDAETQHGAIEHRYADPALVSFTDTTVWVRETHNNVTDTGGTGATDSGKAVEPINEIVAIGPGGTIGVLAAGADFYASPQPSPDGNWLAFISWNHPNMPWDHTRLHVIDLRHAITDPCADIGIVLDGPALQQPRWSPDGQLHVISDANGYWDIVKVDIESKTSQPLIDRPQWAAEVEFGVPTWAFAEQTYAWVRKSSDTLWCTWVDRGVGHIGLIVDGQLQEVDTGFTEFGRLEVTPAGSAVTVASSWTKQAEVVEIAPDGTYRSLSEDPNTDVPPLVLDERSISVPQAFEFSTKLHQNQKHESQPAETESAAMAYGFYFPPASATHQGPADELPPLIVLSHGGPTGRARSSLDLGIQYWTNRGIGVVDVNYRGSTGYGTAYRNDLRELWGVADVDDCVNAALYLSGQARLADPKRLVIKGGSAGGYTTLCALTSTDTFAAGLTRYGVADLESLVRETHKFEAHYLDTLIGPWPQAAEIYQQRSPLYRSELLRTPMLVLQGDQDKVVPPSQSEQLVEALAAAGVPHCYLLFEGEAHGFRQAINITNALQAELSFLSQVLGFSITDQLDPVSITGHPQAQPQSAK